MPSERCQIWTLPAGLLNLVSFLTFSLYAALNKIIIFYRFLSQTGPSVCIVSESTWLEAKNFLLGPFSSRSHPPESCHAFFTEEWKSTLNFYWTFASPRLLFETQLLSEYNILCDSLQCLKYQNQQNEMYLVSTHLRLDPNSNFGGPGLGFDLTSSTCWLNLWTWGWIPRQAYLLSGLRFSTAVWVWLVVRMETCSPSGPLAVDITSYSEERPTKSSPDQQNHGMLLLKGWTTQKTKKLKTLLHASKSFLVLISFSLFLCTGGVIVSFLPVQDDEWRASLHRHHSEVGGRRLGWGRHICLAGLIFREVVEGGGDGTRLIWFLARLVDDMRRFGRRRGSISQHFALYGR